MDKMKDIPGMKEMMSKMGMGGKIDMKAMTNKLQETLRKSKMKDRMNKKREQRAGQRQANPSASSGSGPSSGAAASPDTSGYVSGSDPAVTQKSDDTFFVKVDGSVPQKSKKGKKKR